MFAKKTQAALMLAASAALLGACASYDMDEGQMASASADSTVMVGGAAMYPTRNIIETRCPAPDPSPSSHPPMLLSRSCLLAR